MRWKGRKVSANIEDRRGGARRPVSRGKKVGGGLGLGTIAILAIAYFLGADPSQLMQIGQQQVATGQQTDRAPQPAPTDELAQFVGVVLQDTEDAWKEIFPKQVGKNYTVPVLVLFSGETNSSCGHASAATGPFYCSADEKLYIDLSFYKDLRDRFGAPGDFAMAYVVAHEVAHHVQYLLGITSQVHAKKRQLSKEEGNKLSVKLELQADFLAGVWAHHAHKMKNILEKGDIEEAIQAAEAIGDDRLQMRSKGYVVPESFTHGTSAQRVRWFKKGLKTGDLRQGDTFGARTL